MSFAMAWQSQEASSGGIVRTPDLSLDGWCLEDGEQLHREAPKTFFVPDLELRKILQPGDFAKLVFRIALEEADEIEAVERMWVIVKERLPTGYMGILDNEPSGIMKNDTFWLGTELPFEPKHIIAVEHANKTSLDIALRPAAIPWTGL